MKPTIQINTRKFLPSASSLVATLFQGPVTGFGIYRKRKHSVLFMRANGSPLACLVANPNQSPFFVSAFAQTDGKTRYAFSLSSSDAETLGVSTLGYAELCNEAKRIWESFNQ